MHAINVIFIVTGIFLGVLLVVLLIDVSYSDKINFTAVNGEKIKFKHYNVVFC